MNREEKSQGCQICGSTGKLSTVHGLQACDACKPLIVSVASHPERMKQIWQQLHDEPILPGPGRANVTKSVQLPDVLEGKRYRTIDREHNKWYLSVSELDGAPVEIFASTAFDRDHELQSRISNLTTITRLISLTLRHIFLGEPLTLAKVLKQIKRSSRQKNDLPDMLYGVLCRYDTSATDTQQT